MTPILLLGRSLCLVFLLCAAFVCHCHAQALAGPVGVLAAIEGEVWILRPPQGQFVPAKLYQEIFERDLVRTGQTGKAKILFYDDSMVDLGIRSELEITRYYYSQEAKKRDSLLCVSQGRLRFLVTKFFVEKKADFRLQTPSAVVGVRGTEGILHVENPTVVFCLSGLLEVLNPSTGELQDLRPLMKALVERGMPMAIEPIDPRDVQALRNEFQFSGRSGGKSQTGSPPEVPDKGYGPSQDRIQELQPREPKPPDRPPIHHH